MSRVSPTLDSVLRRVHARARRITAAAQALLWLAFLLAALLAAVALDAWLALPPAGLAALDVALLGLAAAPAAVAFLVRRRNPYRAEAMALLVHRQLALPPGRLINAVEFSLAAPPGASVELVAAAIRRGEELAATIDPGRVVDVTVLRRPARWAAGAALSCFALAALAPAVFLAVGPRLFHPLSDLPPFTRLSFEVAIRPVEIYVGQGAEIRVRVTGPAAPAEASTVFLGAHGLKTRTPMWREIFDPPPDARPDAPPGETAFSLRIENLAASFDFYIDTSSGRSGRQRVEVRRHPLIDRVTLHYTPPLYTGWKPVFETLGPGGIGALRRTRVAIQCRSNVALGGGTLELRPGKDAPAAAAGKLELKPDPADPRCVTGSFEMAWSGSFALGVTGADGLPGAKAVTGPLVCTPDLPPQVSIVEPEAVSVAPEGWKVPVRIEASDDVGIAGLALMTRVGNGKFQAQALAGDPARQTV